MIISICLIGCEVPFDPVIEGGRPIVVYALLNAGVDTQVVRVHQTIRPDASDPGYPSVPGTSVLLQSGQLEVAYQAVQFSVGGRSIEAFLAPGWKPMRGTAYRLLVQTAHGDVTADVTVPGACTISTNSAWLLQDPYRQPTYEVISCGAVLSREAYGVLIRLVVEYDEFDGSGWTIKRLEVPLAYRSASQDPTAIEGIYPHPRRRTTFVVTEGEPQQEWEGFSNDTYRRSLKIIYGLASGSVRMRRALFIVHQLDRHFFAYYSLANHFLDPNSIRVDRPDYSNVSGALGFFGALTSDSLAVPLPADLSPP